LTLKVVFVLLSVAFVTLFERKVLGLSQARLGPNKVSAHGVVQPLLDALKLFGKRRLLPGGRVGAVVSLGPAVSLFVMLLCWWVVPEALYFLGIIYSVLFFCVHGAGGIRLFADRMGQPL
jgi:NADH:ubiquinone oxidoreductase subunit H